MRPGSRLFAVSAALLLALATAIGALGAHLLRVRLTPERYEILQTAVHYQFFHALGLLVGVVLFSGSLYGLLAGAPRALGILTPLGGLSLIGGWCLAALGLRTVVQPSPDAR